jgi:glutaredoxin
MRVYSVDSSIDYTCPYCIETFARFSEVSIDLEEHGDEQEQVTGGDEQE